MIQTERSTMKIEVIKGELIFGAESQDEFVLLWKLQERLDAHGAVIDDTQRCLSIKVSDDAPVHSGGTMVKVEFVL